MKPGHVLLIVLIAALAGFGGAQLAGKTGSTQAQKETAYERVVRTGTIRCGYALWPPTMFVRDAQTGELGGIFHDIAEEMATKLELKIDWVEESGWGSYIEGLKAERFDLFCAPLWQDAKRGRYLNYTVPLTYSALHFYTRQDDHRFDRDLALLNNPQYKLATMDGEQSQSTASTYFPKAQQVSIPALGDITQLMLAVASGKADGVFLEPSLAKQFSAANLGKIRQVTLQPFQVFPNMFGATLGQDDFTRMLDSALTEMLNAGEIDRIISKYEPDRSVFMPVAKPYTYVEPLPIK